MVLPMFGSAPLLTRELVFSECLPFCLFVGCLPVCA